MSDLHFVGGASRNIESVGPNFVRNGLLRAREKSWHAFQNIRSKIELGMSEADARDAALRTLASLGADKHWHKPYVRLGPGTALTFYDSLQTDYRLKEGDPIYMDLGPVWRDEQSDLEYEGDVGDTFIMGSNPEAEKCAATARRLWTDACDLWRNEGGS